MVAVKIRPWTEWKARIRDWLVGIKVRITFEMADDQELDDPVPYVDRLRFRFVY